MTAKRTKILAELKRLYPDAGPELNFSNPYETLVATILSAQCTDRQVNRVTPELFAKYPDLEAMAAAGVDEVYAIVKSCGFKSKAGNIVESCRQIALRHGGQVPRTMGELTKLPGVGQKTANVVLANAFGVPAIAVDTHVFRVSNRLGLAQAKNVEQTEKQLRENIPSKDWVAAHHWLIYHGRRVCHARGPECETCTLRPLCGYGSGEKPKAQDKPKTNRKPSAEASAEAQPKPGRKTGKPGQKKTTAAG